jgi:hypothetical protein
MRLAVKIFEKVAEITTLFDVIAVIWNQVHILLAYS